MSAPPNTPSPRKWYDSTFLVMALLLFLWPIGVFALIKNRRMGGFSKFIIGGGITAMLFLGFGLSGFAGYWYYRHRTFSNVPYIGKYLGGKSTKLADASAKDPQKPPDAPTTDDPNKSPEPLPPDKTDLKTPEPPRPHAVAEDEKRKQDEAQKAKALEEANAKLEAAKREAAKLDAEKQEAARLAKEKADRDMKEKELAEKAERERAEAEKNTRNIEALATELKDRRDMLAGRKKQQADKYKHALEDYNLAIAIEPHLSNMEVAFKLNLNERYKTDRIDPAKFDEFFTDDYVRDYNAQIKKRSAAMGQYIKTLRDSDAQVIAEEKKLSAEIDAANAKLAAAQKPAIEPAPPDRELEKILADQRDMAANLPERLVTLNDLRERFHIAGSRRTNSPPLADNRKPPQNKDPFEDTPAREIVQRPPQKDTADIVPLPPLENNTPTPRPIVNPPKNNIPPPPVVQEKTIPPPDNGFAFTNTDVPGDWSRSDGKVVWIFDAGGTLSIRGPRRSQGTWVYDEKTHVMSVTHAGTFFKFTVQKDPEKNQVFMSGGVNGTGQMRFNKVSR